MKTSVMAIDAAERTATLQGGEEVRFGKALLATGANVNILRVDGSDNEGIHYLRAFGNSDAIREQAEKRARAARRRQLHRLRGRRVAHGQGVEVTIVMMEDVALSRTFGEEAGASSTTCSSRRGSRSSAARSWQASRATATSTRW